MSDSISRLIKRLRDYDARKSDLVLPAEAVRYSVDGLILNDKQISVTQTAMQQLLSIGRITGPLPITASEIRYQLEKLRRETGIEFTAKTFRKHFSHQMEMAGASGDIINLHQGRSQHGVLYEHYLTDPSRAVRICRVYIDKMFGEKAGLRVVR